MSESNTQVVLTSRNNQTIDKSKLLTTQWRLSALKYVYNKKVKLAELSTFLRNLSRKFRFNVGIKFTNNHAGLMCLNFKHLSVSKYYTVLLVIHSSNAAVN